MSDHIRVELDAVDCICGIYPEERVKTQPVRVGLTLWLELDECARTGNLASSIDYAAVAVDVENLLVQGRFELLEVAAAAILKKLLGGRVTKACVELTKLAALGGKARATVVMTRPPN